MAALATGLCQGCVDECTRYARERQAFGQPIAGFQAIAFKIADMEVQAHRPPGLAAGRGPARRRSAVRPGGGHRQAVRLRGGRHLGPRGRPGPRRLRLHGGVPGGRFYRDAKVLEIGEGTSEVMRILIALGRALTGAAVFDQQFFATSLPEAIATYSAGTRATSPKSAS